MDSPLPMPALPLETPRLLLRRFALADLEDLLAFRSLPGVARFLYTAPLTHDGVREMLEGWVKNGGFADDNDRLVLAMERKDSGQVVGEVLLILRSAKHRQGEIGFVLHPQFHRQGLAREASLPLLKLGFEHFGLHRIYGRCDARNTASARLLERLGLRREAELHENEFIKGEWVSELVFALLAREWAQRAATVD